MTEKEMKRPMMILKLEVGDYSYVNLTWFHLLLLTAPSGCDKFVSNLKQTHINLVTILFTIRPTRSPSITHKSSDDKWLRNWAVVQMVASSDPTPTLLGT